jgi:hypothetical protein
MSKKKIQKNIVEIINGNKVTLSDFNTIKFVSFNRFKFTKEETKLAMKMAMRIRKRASKRLYCNFRDVDLSLCLKEAYRRIASDKLNPTVLSKENKKALKKIIQKEFNFDNLNSFCRNVDIYSIKPQNTDQNIILDIARLEMITRGESHEYTD